MLKVVPNGSHLEDSALSTVRWVVGSLFFIHYAVTIRAADDDIAPLPF